MTDFRLVFFSNNLGYWNILTEWGFSPSQIFICKVTEDFLANPTLLIFDKFNKRDGRLSMTNVNEDDNFIVLYLIKQIVLKDVLLCNSGAFVDKHAFDSSYVACVKIRSLLLIAERARNYDGDGSLRI